MYSTLTYESDMMSCKFRHKYDLGDETKAVDLEEIIRIRGSVLLKKPLSQALSGGFFRFDSVTVILVNTNMTLGHMRFTMAHELYHAEFDTELEGRTCLVGNNLSKNDLGERSADFFATSLLMPANGLRTTIENMVKDRADFSLTTEDIFNLENIYKVSHQAMCYRLKNLNLIDFAQLHALLEDVRIKEEVKRLGLGDDLYCPTCEDSVSSNFSDLAIELFKNKKISKSKFIESLEGTGISLPSIVKRLDIDNG